MAIPPASSLPGPQDENLKIEECPITVGMQAELESIVDRLLPGRKDRTNDANQISQILVVFRDGGLLGLSALTNDGAGNIVPVAKDYTARPIVTNPVQYSTSISIVSTIHPSGFRAASIWRWIGNIHKCTGG